MRRAQSFPLLIGMTTVSMHLTKCGFTGEKDSAEIPKGTFAVLIPETSCDDCRNNTEKFRRVLDIAQSRLEGVVARYDILSRDLIVSLGASSEEFSREVEEFSNSGKHNRSVILDRLAQQIRRRDQMRRVVHIETRIRDVSRDKLNAAEHREKKCISGRISPFT